LLRFIRLTVIALLAVVILTLAVTNRHDVTLYIDPIAGKDVASAIQAPLYVVIFACVMVGVLLGALSMWIGQGRWRRQAKARSSEVQKLKREMALLETELSSLKKGKRNLSAALFGTERSLPH
jgi:uncharacterized integral membrane protein